MGTQVNRAGGRGVEIWRGVDGSSLIDHSGEKEHLNKTSWVEWEWRWALIGINQPGVLVGGRV